MVPVKDLSFLHETTMFLPVEVLSVLKVQWSDRGPAWCRSVPVFRLSSLEGSCLMEDGFFHLGGSDAHGLVWL